MSESLTSISDNDLLKQFARTRKECVFAELVRRHGRLVMSVCLRVLRNQHDAEDAFQATFLVLAQKCGSIRKREALKSWLCGVAYRLSMNLDRKIHRKDVALEDAPDAEHFDGLGERFDQQVIDEELHGLPQKYRDVLILHYLDGQSSREIAEELGTSQGTVDGRIKRGRQELRVRLAKRGVALMTALVAAQVSAQQASAMVSPALISSTVSMATQPLAVCSQSLVQLAGTELMKASLTKGILVVGAAFAVATVASFSRTSAAAEGLPSSCLLYTSPSPRDS